MTQPMGYSVDSDGKLEVSSCSICGHTCCPPRPFHCNRPMRVSKVEAIGEVQYWTQTTKAPPQHRPPFILLIATVANKVRVLARLQVQDGKSNITKGSKVKFYLSVEEAEGSVLHGPLNAMLIK